MRLTQSPRALSSSVSRIRCAELARLWLNPIMSKVEDDVDGYEKASKGLASLQALNPATEGKYTAPPPAFMRYKV